MDTRPHARRPSLGFQPHSKGKDTSAKSIPGFAGDSIKYTRESVVPAIH